MWSGQEEAFQETPHLLTQPSADWGSFCNRQRANMCHAASQGQGWEYQALQHVGTEEVFWGCSSCSLQKETQEYHQEEGVLSRPS